MGVRKDLDRVSERYIYYILNDDTKEVIYVGCAINPISRYKSHLKRAKKESAFIYRYIRENKIKTKLKIVLKVKSTYKRAEEIEIKHINKHKDTVMNFYNNPNKKRLYQIYPKKKRKNNFTTEKQRK